MLKYNVNFSLMQSPQSLNADIGTVIVSLKRNCLLLKLAAKYHFTFTTFCRSHMLSLKLLIFPSNIFWRFSAWEDNLSPRLFFMGEPKMVKPCQACQCALRSHNISWLFYSRNIIRGLKVFLFLSSFSSFIYTLPDTLEYQQIIETGQQKSQTVILLPLAIIYKRNNNFNFREMSLTCGYCPNLLK